MISSPTSSGSVRWRATQRRTSGPSHRKKKLKPAARKIAATTEYNSRTPFSASGRTPVAAPRFTALSWARTPSIVPRAAPYLPSQRSISPAPLLSMSQM